MVLVKELWLKSIYLNIIFQNWMIVSSALTRHGRNFPLGWKGVASTRNPALWRNSRMGRSIKKQLLARHRVGREWSVPTSVVIQAKMFFLNPGTCVADAALLTFSAHVQIGVWWIQKTRQRVSQPFRPDRSRQCLIQRRAAHRRRHILG